ncbi:unnamed protein product [Darwinula stevensoni]|uniref:Uncharacterized protein n=1 Tax=Darwinula stevensoni TaxID=69355 RepID=A0A7R9A9N7_9CRUS|nr:unnamed protein product [Darwinula stevensoni]CAG0897585.1 unnamed protein product [Darwinula stevensoni]
MENPSQPCLAFNYRESDGTCQLLHGGSSQLVPAEGFQAFVQFLCLTDYPKMKNANESFEDWNGEHPAPQGAKVVFTCQKGFVDGPSTHTASCSCNTPDVWCTTFALGEEDGLCPP